MLYKAIKDYFYIIKGDNPASRWIFVVTTSFLLAYFFYLLFNFDGQARSEIPIFKLYTLNISYNPDRIFLFVRPAFFGLESFSFDLKIIEFVMLWLLLSYLVSVSFGRLHKHRLRDALSPVRDKLYGRWVLTIDEFDSRVKTPLTLPIVIAATIAEKLNLIVRPNNIYGISYATPQISLSVGDGNSRVEITFHIQSYIDMDGKVQNIFLFIMLTHLAFSDATQMKFSGNWYSINDLGDSFGSTGVCEMLLVSQAPGADASQPASPA